MITLLDEFPFPVWRAQPEGKCDYFNKAWMSFTGRTLEQELGDGWADGVHPDDLLACTRDYYEALRARVPFQLQYRLRRYDGEFRWIADHGAPFNDEEGNFAGYIGACHDITESRKAEETLKKSQQLFAAFMDNLPGYAWIKDLAGRYVYANNMLAEVGPYRAGWLGKTDADLWPAEIAATYRANDETVSATGVPLQTVEPYSLSGAAAYAAVSKFPILGAGGAVEMVGGAAIDITESLAGERANAELAAIIKSSNDAIISMQLDGVIVSWNAAAERIYGYHASEAIGRSIRILTRPDQRREVNDVLERIGRGESIQHFETTRFRKDGTQITVSLTVSPIRMRNGDVTGVSAIARDITEEQRVDQNLAESEQRFRELAENINEVFWLSDAKNIRMNYISPAYEKVWGRSCESLYAAPKSWMEAVHPEDKERVMANRAKRSPNEVYRNTYRIIRPDGSIRWIRDRGFPVRDKSGEAVRFAGIAEDITERKTIEKALESAEEQYHSIFNNAVDGIFRTSPDGKFLVANPAAARILGFASPEELIEERRDIARQVYVDPRRREEFKRLLQEQGVVNGFEYEAYRKDGSRVWISENTRAVHSPSGETLYFEGIFEDVTERKRAKEALRESEERFRTIFEQAPLGISEGEIATARFISANQRYVDILGYTIDELRGLTFKDYTHPEDLQKDLVEFQKLAAGEIMTYAMEKRHVRKDGAIIWVNLTVSGLARPGEKPLNCIAVIDDITDRIQAEAALAAQAIRYKTLMETSTDSIYVLDADGNLQEANAAFLSRRGYTAAEVKGLKVADWDDAQWSREQLQERLRKLIRKSAVFETRHRCKDGSVFDVEVCATSVRIGGEQLFFCVTRDTTERKKAEFALRQLAQVSAASSDYIALIGRDFRYQFVNDTYLKARGLHLDNMIGRHMKEIVGQERFEQLGRPQVEACLRGEEVENFEWTDFRSDFRCFLHVKVAPLRELDGTISGAVMSGRDITGRHEAEEALRESEERFRTIFEQAPLGISEGEIATARFISANQRYVDILGYTIDELRALTFKDYTHPEDLQKDLVEFQRLAAGKIRTYAMEKRYIRKDSAIIWVNLTVSGLARPGEKPLKCLAVVEDITERKQAEDRLRRSEEKFKALFDLAPVGIAFLDSRLNIVDCNPALERMSRLSREELLGGAWQRRTFLNADGSPRLPGERVSERAVTEKRLVNGVETGAVLESGEIVWAEVSAAPLPVPGARAVVIMHDITERKQAEEALHKANRQLRILSRRRAQVQEDERKHLARELHDQIGQALTATKISVKSARRSKKREMITRHLDNTVAVLDQILMQVRQMTLDLRPAALDDLGLVPALRLVLHDYARRGGWHIRISGDANLERPDAEVETACFRIALEALTNILRHAKAQKVWLELHNATDSLHLIVRDDGVGFDLAEAEKRVERDRLGLVGMRERATGVGGAFECRSVIGHGTEVHAFLPFHPV